MTMVTDFVVPPMGEPIDSARLVRWVVMPGQAFRADDILVEIETDKSIVEVPASQDGRMVEHLVAVDGRLDADTPIARIEIEGEGAAVEEGGDDAEPVVSPAAQAATEGGRTVGARIEAGRSTPEQAAGGPSAARKFATPAARDLARKGQLPLDSVTGSGPRGRVTKADVLRAVAGRPVEAGVGAGRGRGMHDLTVATAYGDAGVTVWESVNRRDTRTLVLIHGMFGDRNVWAGTADALAHAGYRVLAMDLPCHGSTKADVTVLGDIVEFAAEIVSKQCSGTIALVGHSFGGAVATRLARQPALGVDTLVLIAPVGLGSQIDQTFLDGMAYAESSEALLRELRKLTVTGMTPSTAYVNELRGRIATRRDRIIALCRQVSWNGVQQIDTLPDLLALQAKTVLIQGRRDRVIAWEHALNAPPRVALHLLAEAGHMPQWEATSATTDIVLDSLGR